MDSAELKAEFGKDIVFWGGGVDTRRVLGAGTPEEVRAEVKRRVEDFKPGGGFVFNTVHNIQGNVPPENLVAMWEAVRDPAVQTRTAGQRTRRPGFSYETWLLVYSPQVVTTNGR